MAAELGQTHDPAKLIPGDPDAVHATAWSMRAFGDVLHEAGSGLQRINTADGWSGEAADRFRDAFDGEPIKWLVAGDCFHDASKALDRYADTLSWAQQRANETIRLWNDGQAATTRAQAEHAESAQRAQEQPPAGAGAAPEVPFTDPGEAKRQAARDALNRARTQLASAGDTAADTVGQARDQAPQAPGWSEQTGQALTAVGGALSDAGGHLVNTAASLGNAALNHPTYVAAAAGGAGLTAVSAAGETAGAVLDATGVGAVAGVPLNVASAAGVATGVGTMGAAMAGLASEAGGDDAVNPVDTDDTAPHEDTAPQPAEPPREISGRTDHGEERAQGRDGHGVSDEAMNDAVENPVKAPKEQSGGTFRYDGQDATVVLNPEGKVVTTWARNSNGWRHS